MKCKDSDEVLTGMVQAEQEEIVRKRPAGQKGLTLREIRKMDYLSKVWCSVGNQIMIPLLDLSIENNQNFQWNLKGYRWNTSRDHILIDGVQRGKERCQCLWYAILDSPHIRVNQDGNCLT